METDQELFAEALSDKHPQEPLQEQPQQPAPEPPQEPPQEQRQRDDKGRFVSAEPHPEQTPEPSAQPEPPQSHHVPLRELLDEREKRQKYEREIAEERRAREMLHQQILEMQRAQQPTAQAPDIFEKPQEFVQGIQDYVQRQLREHRGEISLQSAHRAYGEEFADAYQSIMQAAQLGDRASWQAVVEARDPGEALMQWHRQRKIMEKTGGDLNKWIESQFENAEFQKRYADYLRAKQGSNPTTRPAVSLPPSLSRVPSAASQNDAVEEDSDAALLKQALRR